MKILFDPGTPAPLRNHLRERSVDRSAERGWELLENGELIRKAEEEEGYVRWPRFVGQPDGAVKHHAFHSYAMKQALQEGFILDVLAHYTPATKLLQARQDGRG